MPLVNNFLSDLEGFVMLQEEEDKLLWKKNHQQGYIMLRKLIAY